MAELRLIRDGNPSGEFSFTAPGLFLSFHLAQVLELEQRTSDASWAGRSFRGDVKVLLPGEGRTFRHRLPARFAHITIPTKLLAEFGTPAEALRPHIILRDPPLRHLMDALLAESLAEHPTSQLFAESMAQALVARLASLNGREPHEPRSRMPPVLFQRALELIEAELSRDLSVVDLAQACGLRPSHFTALFKASAGEPPHRYQTRRRVERARELLQRGNSPASAALAVGFCDQSHLGRHMRRLTGHSPSHWQGLSANRSGRRRNIL
jgi:AraC family transcriptional regulator